MVRSQLDPGIGAKRGQRPRMHYSSNNSDTLRRRIDKLLFRRAVSTEAIVDHMNGDFPLTRGQITMLASKNITMHMTDEHGTFKYVLDAEGDIIKHYTGGRS